MIRKGILPPINLPKIKLKRIHFNLLKSKGSYNVSKSKYISNCVIPSISSRFRDENSGNAIKGNFIQKSNQHTNMSDFYIFNTTTNSTVPLNESNCNTICLIPPRIDINHEKFKPCHRNLIKHDKSIRKVSGNIEPIRFNKISIRRKATKSTIGSVHSYEINPDKILPLNDEEMQKLYISNEMVDGKNEQLKPTVPPPRRKRKHRSIVPASAELKTTFKLKKTFSDVWIENNNQAYVELNDSLDVSGMYSGTGVRDMSIEKCGREDNMAKTEHKSDSWTVKSDMKNLDNETLPLAKKNKLSLSSFEDSFNDDEWIPEGKYSKRKNVKIADLPSKSKYFPNSNKMCHDTVDRMTDDGCFSKGFNGMFTKIPAKCPKTFSTKNIQIYLPQTRYTYQENDENGGSYGGGGGGGRDGGIGDTMNKKRNSILPENMQSEIENLIKSSSTTAKTCTSILMKNDENLKQENCGNRTITAAVPVDAVGFHSGGNQSTELKPVPTATDLVLGSDKKICCFDDVSLVKSEINIVDSDYTGMEATATVAMVILPKRADLQIISQTDVVKSKTNGNGADIADVENISATNSDVVDVDKLPKRKSVDELSQDIQSTKDNRPKYTLRTSQVGTLVVCEESFRNRKVRRRPRSFEKNDENNERRSVSVQREKVIQKFEYCGSPNAGQENWINRCSPVGTCTNTKIIKSIGRLSKSISNIENLQSKNNALTTSSSSSQLNSNEKQPILERKLNYKQTNILETPIGDLGFVRSMNGSGCTKTSETELHQNAISSLIKNENNQLKSKCQSFHSMEYNGVDYGSDTDFSRKQFEKKILAKQCSSQSRNYNCNKESSSNRDSDRRTQKKLLRKKRRSVSVGNCDARERRLSNYSSSSSTSIDTETVAENNCIRYKIRGRNRLRNLNNHEMDFNGSGDQVVTLKNSVSLSHLNPQATLISDETTSDQEVLFKLVQRLASLQHYPHRKYLETTESVNKCGSEVNNSINYNSSSSNNNNNSSSNNHNSNKNLRNNINYKENTFFGDKELKPNENNNNYYCEQDSDEVNGDSVIEKCVFDLNMGSNVSRHSGKGLSGRRTQSSGNLCNENQQTSNGSYSTPNVKRKAENGKSTVIYGHINPEENTAESCSVNTATKLMMAPLCVSKKDRNKFCGSLPNHLDADDVYEENHAHDYIDNNNTLPNVDYVTVASGKQIHHHHNHYQHSSAPPPPMPPSQPPIESSPHNNSSSEKESTSSSTNLGSTFRSNHDNKPDIQLKLPINRSNIDTGCDQGYGSERSPEDELPPPLPLISLPYQCQVPQNYDKYNGCEYSFITSDCCFAVQVTKGPRGLGLSVSGGVDSNAAFPGLIRIKRLFPHQAAWCTGMLQPGDILLEANEIALTGLTNYEALEVLRTLPNIVTLLVCRPCDEQYRKLSPPSEPPKPPQRANSNSLQVEYSHQPYFTGEFEIIMVKQQGSLGFTLRKEDESVLGHYVRALVREPALNDGRIKPGDKIVAVNDVPLCPMTHEEAVIFLRQAAPTVKLRLYRDNAQTPIAATSPTHSENTTICNTIKQKVCLRPEAINLLSDIAYRNKKQNPGPDSSGSSITSNATSPRRLRRGTRPSLGNINVNETNKTDLKNLTYIKQGDSTATYSDSEASTLSQSSFLVQPNSSDNPRSVTFTLSDDNNTFQSIQSTTGNESEFYGEDELWRMVDETDGNYDNANRPNFLDLAGNMGSTPVVSRKPKFQFTVAANAYELNNLDNEALDAPMYPASSVSGASKLLPISENNQDFTSLPCETFLVACRTEKDLVAGVDSFNHKNPIYQSAHVPSSSGDDSNTETKKDGTKSLLKWKGVMLSSDEEKDSPEDDLTSVATAVANPSPGTEKDLVLKNQVCDEQGQKLLTVELNRGWNSRLGFSLQNDSSKKYTFISAIYSDSVAARDGRLQVGDQIVMVNDESVEQMSTSEIIDLLRIIRGSISVTVLRTEKSTESISG